MGNVCLVLLVACCLPPELQLQNWSPNWVSRVADKGCQCDMRELNPRYPLSREEGYTHYLPSQGSSFYPLQVAVRWQYHTGLQWVWNKLLALSQALLQLQVICTGQVLFSKIERAGPGLCELYIYKGCPWIRACAAPSKTAIAARSVSTEYNLTAKITIGKQCSSASRLAGRIFKKKLSFFNKTTSDTKTLLQ